MKQALGLWALAAICLCGCQTYNYRVVQPSVSPSVLTARDIVVDHAPLEYRLREDRGRVVLRILNPTPDRVILRSDRSHVTDPTGESHPVRGRVIGPHSYIRISLPPVPVSFTHPDYNWGWGWDAWGWGWGWPDYVPMSGPYYSEGFFGAPPIVYPHDLTMYDWRWKQGPVHLHLGYTRGSESFEQDFEFDREPEP